MFGFEPKHTPKAELSCSIDPVQWHPLDPLFCFFFCFCYHGVWYHCANKPGNTGCTALGCAESSSIRRRAAWERVYLEPLKWLASLVSIHANPEGVHHFETLHRFERLPKGLYFKSCCTWGLRTPTKLVPRNGVSSFFETWPESV